MAKKLNKEAIDEITYLLDEVKDVVRLLKEFGIYIYSDCWTASTWGGEDILHWKREDFEKIDDINDGDKFYVGGNICTGSQHEYKDKWIIAPKELAEVQGEIFEDYLTSVMHSVSLKHFKLEIEDEYGLTDNCGWEHWITINATVQKSAITDNDAETKKLIEEIIKEEDCVIELSASPLYNNPKNNFNQDSDLVPNGDFPYMVEFFSTHLVCQDDDDYQGCFSANDYNGKYIRDAMALINDVEKRAKELADKYANKGVKVTVNDFNEGCQYGMAVYVWIPYQ